MLVKVKQKNLVFGLCLILSVLFVFPQMQFTQPNFLDVAETWSFGKKIFQNSISEFSNPDRFRPMYALERSVMNVLFSYNAPYYFLFQVFLLTITVYLAYMLLHRTSIHWILLFFISGDWEPQKIYLLSFCYYHSIL